MSQPDRDLEYAIRHGTLKDKDALKQLHSRRTAFLAKDDLLPEIHERGRAAFAAAIDVEALRAASTRGDRVVEVLRDVLVHVGSLCVENKQQLADAEVTTGQKRMQATEGVPEKGPKVARHGDTEETQFWPSVEGEGTGPKLGYNLRQTSKTKQNSAQKSRILILPLPAGFEIINAMPPLKGRPPKKPKSNKKYKSADLVVVSDSDSEVPSGRAFGTQKRGTRAVNTRTKDKLVDGSLEDTFVENTPTRDKPIEDTPARDVATVDTSIENATTADTVVENAFSENTAPENTPVRRSSRNAHKQGLSFTNTSTLSNSTLRHASTQPTQQKIVSFSLPPTSKKTLAPLAIPPFPPLDRRELDNFQHGANIAIENITETYMKDPSLPLLDIIQDLEDNKPTLAKGERKSAMKTKMYGGEWVYHSLRSVWGDRENPESGEEGGIEEEGDAEFIARALADLEDHVAVEYGRMA